ncbi:unnamed protein product [Dibothriocephalus latus]|uniref:Reverse transcriptase domain-containing protein n=1 Tax=Dibothriocephalus latus TaxID=60516 RepID=A0A3P7R3R7_DIBLA|nr:unnamed protein product [Dibothriocephalus latus]
MKVGGIEMLSLDVSSLITNRPMVETKNYPYNVIWDTDYEIGLPMKILRELFIRCTQTVQLLCNGRFCRQIGGVTMGLPLGPFLANIFMGKIEKASPRGTINDLAI